MSTEGEAKIFGLTVEIALPEVHRTLGYPRARAPAPGVRERIDALWPIGVQLMRPRGALRIVTAEMAAPAEVPRPTPTMGIGVCTIGSDLEEEGACVSQRGEILDALILDALGSVGVEAAADALCQHLCAAARSEGLAPSRRVSPGYGRWGIHRQKELLALLPIEALGIQLTGGLMMIPRKSVSFAVRLQGGGAVEGENARCAGCSLEGCLYRIDPVANRV
jgi:hypothetical protein